MATSEEQRSYSKGYQAGWRRKERENRAVVERAIREQFEREVFLAVLPHLLANPWGTDGKPWQTMKQFIDGARDFASLSGKRFNYTAPPDREVIDHMAGQEVENA